MRRKVFAGKQNAKRADTVFRDDYRLHWPTILALTVNSILTRQTCVSIVVQLINRSIDNTMIAAMTVASASARVTPRRRRLLFFRRDATRRDTSTVHRSTKCARTCPAFGSNRYKLIAAHNDVVVRLFVHPRPS